MKTETIEEVRNTEIWPQQSGLQIGEWYATRAKGAARITARTNGIFIGYYIGEVSSSPEYVEWDRHGNPSSFDGYAIDPARGLIDSNFAKAIVEDFQLKDFRPVEALPA